MMLGLIGAPNKGKSTIFSAMTLSQADIADYPFTTINPNLGIAYATKECPEKELGIKCNPRNSLCDNGTRKIPINVTDVAGLIPGAHIGKGMGTQFLNDIISADALILVVDLSGETDIQGRPGSNFNQKEDIRMVEEELANWLSGIIEKNMSSLSRKKDGIDALVELLSGFKPSEDQIRESAEENGITLSNISWNHESSLRFSRSFLARNKPIVIAANKMDKSSKDALEKFRKELEDYTVIGCSGAIELALRKAAKSGIITYNPGNSSFVMGPNATEDQKRALSYISSYLKKNGSTGIHEIINETVFTLSHNIVVYPVENENKYADSSGSILPDAILMAEGSTALDLAEKIHTEIAAKMLYAIDARNKIRVAKDYILKDGDIIKIVSAAK